MLDKQIIKTAKNRLKKVSDILMIFDSALELLEKVLEVKDSVDNYNNNENKNENENN